MKKILITGLVNFESSVFVNQFPVNYSPIEFNFFGCNISPSGVGLNICYALKELGSNPYLLTLSGNDLLYKSLKLELEEKKINHTIINTLKETPQSIVLYDIDGRRKIYTDLKDIQDVTIKNIDIDKLIDDCKLVVSCNINFSRDIMRLAKRKNKLIATDVHVISNIFDEYNKEFIELADILFLSNEYIRGKEQEFIRSIANEYKNKIIVIGMGKDGCLLYDKDLNDVYHFNAVTTRNVVNTVGAGDALFSAFIHFYLQSRDSVDSIKKASYFASYKIGENGASKGFINEEELLKLIKQVD